MSSLMIWPQGSSEALPEYWNFRTHCESVYRELYGRYPGRREQGFMDILQDQMYKWHARIDQQQGTIDFASEHHRTLWLIRWSSP